jgi:hypothetical protein
VHFTDIHLIDAQSPARAEFVDRFADQHCESFPLSSAQRPQETLTLQVLESMNRRVRRIRRGPATKAPLRFAICTGDNIDNEQFNELRWFIDLMDGETWVTPNSGGPSYEGVQAADWGDPEYWHPDRVPDKYKDQYGFPEDHQPIPIPGSRARSARRSWPQGMAEDLRLPGHSRLRADRTAVGLRRRTARRPGARPRRQQDLVAVAKHQRPKAVPLRLEQPAVAGGQGSGGAG